jgi:hypothetical protein
MTAGFTDALVIKPELTQAARLEVLHQDVGPPGQLRRRPAVGIVLEV